MSEFKYAGNLLKVVIRDDSTQLVGNNRATYRTVEVPLTEDQIDSLRLYKKESGIWEDVSVCFFETVDIPIEETVEEPEETGEGEEAEGEEVSDE